ncbi:hypothetical protein ACFL1H_06455, partial [Nanoarchaeota archaeon]
FKKIDYLNPKNYSTLFNEAKALANKKSKNPLYDTIKWIKNTLDQPDYREARKIIIKEIDDLETLIKFGETPVPHCQSWKKNSTLNESLLSFVVDANKKLFLITDEYDNPISMSMTRLIDYDDKPTILVENVYHDEWSDDYGIALLGSIADKAVRMHDETGQNIIIGTSDPRITKAMDIFCEKYKFEAQSTLFDYKPPESKNPKEYWDRNNGMTDSGAEVKIKMDYIEIGYEE